MLNNLKNTNLPVGIILQANSGYCNYSIKLEDISESDNNFIQYNIVNDFNTLSDYEMNVYRTIDIDVIANSAISITLDTITKSGYQNFYNPTVYSDNIGNITGVDFVSIYKNVEDVSEKDIHISVCTKQSDISENIFTDDTTTFQDLWGYSTIDFNSDFLFVTLIDEIYTIYKLEYNTENNLDNFYVKVGNQFTFTLKSKSEMKFENYENGSISSTDFTVNDDDWITTMNIVKSENDIIFNTEVSSSLQTLNTIVAGTKYLVNYNSNYTRYYDDFSLVQTDFENGSYYNRIDKNINIFNMYKSGRRYHSVAGIFIAKTLNKLFDKNLGLLAHNTKMELLFDLTEEEKEWCFDRDYNIFYISFNSNIVNGNRVISKYKNINNIMNNITVSKLYYFFTEFINNNKATKNDLYMYEQMENETNEYIKDCQNIESITYTNNGDSLSIRIKLYGILEDIEIRTNILVDNRENIVEII